MRPFAPSGCRRALPPRSGRCFPLTELAAAILLLSSASARAGAGLALALLAAFSAAIFRSIVRGETPDCHCFGQLHSAPAGGKTLARNVLLAGVATLVLAGGPGRSATAWIGRLSGPGLVGVLGGVALAAVAVSCGFFAVALLRRHGQILLRVEALEQALAERGVAVPAAAVSVPVAGAVAAARAVSRRAGRSCRAEFELEDLDRAPVSLRSLLSESAPVLLVFTDPGCGPCSALMPQIAAWQRDHAGSLRIVLVSRGARDANLAHAREHGLADVLVQADREVSERYGVPGTPAAVLIAAEGTIASSVQPGAQAITALVAGQVAPPALIVHRHDGAVPVR